MQGMMQGALQGLMQHFSTISPSFLRKFSCTLSLSLFEVPFWLVSLFCPNVAPVGTKTRHRSLDQLGKKNLGITSHQTRLELEKNVQYCLKQLYRVVQTTPTRLFTWLLQIGRSQRARENKGNRPQYTEFHNPRAPKDTPGPKKRRHFKSGLPAIILKLFCQN